MRSIFVKELKQLPTEEQKIEIVERKGLGHPDYICDAVMNSVSIALSEEYLKKFGFILHHNIDKALLAAGEAEHAFGGGKILKPMLLVFGDRATYSVGDVSIPINEIIVEVSKKWFKENLRFVDPEKHVKYQIELKRGSEALRSIFEKKKGTLGANDTSAAVGYAPLTRTEKIVMDVERFLNSKEFKKEFPESGEDIKVMGLRMNNELSLTIAMAFVDRFIDSEESYFKSKEEILERLREFLKDRKEFEKINVEMNTLDKKGKGIEGLYLTVTGTCADSADSGQVGRGNRVNGVISLNRPQSSEAAAGKNPVSHVGKIYNVLSYRIANEIYEKVPGIKEVYIWLLSQIGKPIDQPKVAAAQIILESGSLESVEKEVKEIIDEELAKINDFCMDLAKGKIPIC
jgi:S-adenosylmethionine synthetase